MWPGLPLPQDCIKITEAATGSSALLNEMCWQPNVFLIELAKALKSDTGFDRMLHAHRVAAIWQHFRQTRAAFLWP